MEQQKALIRKKFWINDMEAIMGIVLVLVVIGTVNVFSASFVLSETQYHNPYYFLIRQMSNLVGGLIFFLIGLRVNYHKWRDYVLVLVVLTIISLILVLLIGPSINGSRRWLSFGFMQVQPSEGAKLVAIMMSAAYLGACIDKGRQVTGNLAQLFVFALFVVLIEKQPDAGTMCIVIGIPFFMYIIAGLKRKYIERLFAAAVVGVVLVCLLQPYRMERLKVWFDPWQDTQNFGYQTVQSMSAIGSGGLWGMGLGKGISKYAYLPEAHTDFAFAIFCQENGFLGVAFMFMLFVAFSLYSARIASRAPDGFGQMLASGIIMLIVGQGFINIAMVVGVVPVIGVPLPFISYGGTSLIVNMAAVGILINVGQHAKKSENNHTDKESENIAEQKRHLRLVKR